VLMALSNGCDKDRSLPNGYRVFIPDSSTVVIWAPDTDLLHDIVVGPRVWDIGVSGDLVYGEVVFDKTTTMACSPPGFFILDTKTGEKQEGMPKQLWEAELARRGVEHIRLRDP
jgi:hypothetical protein